MLIAYFPLIVALVGLLLWLLTSNAPAKEVGKILFVVGVFWFVGGLATKTIRLFP